MYFKLLHIIVVDSCRVCTYFLHRNPCLDLCMTLDNFKRQYDMYTILQNYTNLVVGKYWIQKFKVVLVVLLHLLLLFWCFCPHKCTSLIIFGQVLRPNILECQLHGRNKNVINCTSYERTRSNLKSLKPSRLVLPIYWSKSNQGCLDSKRA